MPFKVGDHVEWRSQAAGTWRVKRGIVVEVVKPLGRPRLYPHVGGRPEQSYVVRATPERRAAKPQVYFPRTTALRSARSASLAGKD